nr:unnamed protein product [Callosobruchus chinensis]
MLVTYTNLYARTNNRLGDVTADEMRCFIGILLLSGYNCVSRREMYWENSADTNNKLVCKAMSRNRFHLAPLEKHHCVDESMIPYYGRHPTKQFIRGKPIRWGYKIWTATNRLGYIEWLEPYQGSKNKLSEKYKELGLGANVVLQFADRLLSVKDNSNYHIFFDNLFTPLPLLLELKSRGLKGTGTIRENRLPKSCPIKSADKLRKEQKEQRGSLDFASSVNNERNNYKKLSIQMFILLKR